mgnify:CR=1 FL=1
MTVLYTKYMIKKSKKYHKNKEFNPFFVGYNYENQAKFFEDKGKEVEFLLKSSYNSISNSFKKIELKLNEGAILPLHKL